MFVYKNTVILLSSVCVVVIIYNYGKIIRFPNTFKRKTRFEMSLFCFVLSIFVLLYGVNSQEFPQSPCPDIFQYVYDGYVWYGTINLPSPGKTKLLLILVCTLQENIQKNNTGSLETLMDNDTIIDVMNNGGIYKYKYNFPKSIYDNLPTVRSIKLNKQEYCNNPQGKVVGTVSTITLNHILQVRQPGVKTEQNPKRPVKIQQSPTTRPTQSPNIKQTISPISQQEFLSVSKSNNNGRLPKCSATAIQVENNEFPWFVLLYDSANSFLCGGSLVSSKHIVTAAHCAANARWLKVELGINIIPNRQENVIVRYTSEIIKHNNYNSQSGQADIAILVLTEEVDNSKFPNVCIWPSNDGISTKGVAVSFSQTARQKTNLEIVSQENCSSGNLKQISNFCVGGSDSCKGVSGGGMYVARNGRAYLQGIMSTKAETGKETCNITPFADYVDIASYENWLEQNLN